MIIFPFQWVRLETDLSVSETKSKLKNLVAGNSGFLNSVFPLKNNSHFLGKINDDSFYLKRISASSSGQSMRPRIFGKIRNNGNGTEIKLFIRPHPLLLMLFLLITIGFGLACYGIYSFEFETNPYPRRFPKMLVVTIALHIIIVGVFKLFSYAAINEIRDALEAKIKSNTF